MRTLLVALIVAVPALAHAQYNVPSQASGDSRDYGTKAATDDGEQEIVRTTGGHAEIATAPKKTPVGWELGASLDFITSDPSLGGEKLKFTDLVLFRVHALVAIGRRTEIFGGVDLLPKQPSFTDEHHWQGALGGVRVRMNSAWSAYARGQFGPNLDHDGFYAIGEGALQYRRHLAERVLFWESNMGATYTQLILDDRTRKLSQTELLAETGLAIRERKGIFAMWLTFGFHFPIADTSETQMSEKVPFGIRQSALDPQVRVGVSAGMLVGVNRGLDIFVEGSILDRGDLADAATTLPILSGGFDQRRILFGFNRRFGKRRHAW